jgi:hypothetical protein
MPKLSMHSARLAAAALGLILAAAVPARAYTFTDCLWDLNTCRSDSDLFLSLALRDSGVARPVLEPLLPRVGNASYDLPVLLFLSRSSGKPVDRIIDLRARGLTWAQVFRQLGVGYDPLFVDVTADTGYPYRTAYVYWQRNPTTVRLTDTQVRDLVRLQYAHRITGMPVVEIARARRSPVVLVADKHGRTYATSVGVPPGHGGVPPGHGGIPPGRVKSGVPPGHRTVTTAVVRPVVVERQEKVKVKVKAKDRGDEDEGNKPGKGHGEGKGEAKGKGKGKGKH